MTTIRFYLPRFIKVMSAFSMALMFMTSIHSIALADSEGKMSNTDLSRMLRKGGKISDIDLIAGKMVVNGVAYRINMQKTRLITVDNQPIDYFSLDKDLLIRFGLAAYKGDEKIVSLIQITGPRKRLEKLLNH